MVQNKVTSDDDIVSILDCVHENLPDVECGDSHNEIGDNQESDCKSGTSDSEQTDEQAASVVTAWCDVKQQMKLWLLGVPQWHYVHNKHH
jgi:hypothetical protein